MDSRLRGNDVGGCGNDTRGWEWRRQMDLRSKGAVHTGELGAIYTNKSNGTGVHPLLETHLFVV